MFLASFTFKLILAHLWIGLGTNCIKLGLAVPDQVLVNDTVELRCLYDLEGESLYSLSWTFNRKDDKDSNGREFYRYVPRESPRKQLFSLPYLFKLHMSDSHEGTIRLTMLSQNASGIYKCEVSTENTFRTLSSIRQIMVVNSGLQGLYSSTRILLFFVCLITGTQLYRPIL